MLITCNNSHTATNGACGALAVPIGGGNQLRHVVATQTVWLKKPKTMRIAIDGELPKAVTAKDIVLSIIRRTSASAAPPAMLWNIQAPPSAPCRWRA